MAESCPNLSRSFNFQGTSFSHENIDVKTGDVLTVIRGLPDSSFAGCLTDPPYGLGFMGKDWDHGVPGPETWAEVLRVLKPGAFLLAFGGTRTHHRLTCALEDAGFEIRDCMMWLYGEGFPKSLDISKALDKQAGVQREVTGEIPDRWTGSGNVLNFATDRPQASVKTFGGPATDAAKTWDGYGTGLKPAWEPIIVAMKPCDGIFAENALKHGVAGLNIKCARIEYEQGGSVSSNPKLRKHRGLKMRVGSDANGSSWTVKPKGGAMRVDDAGRFPANVILDEDAAAILDEQTWHLHARSNQGASKGGNGMYGHGPCINNFGAGDSGGASRFFYCAKASRKERGAGNTHPTVKPVKLTEYLAKLILPPNREASLLVPFAGSGSEMVGALNAGWANITGIEREPAYVKIARRRLFGDAVEGSA